MPTTRNPLPRRSGPFEQVWEFEIEYAAGDDDEGFYWSTTSTYIIARTGTLHGLPDLHGMAQAAIEQVYRERSIVDRTAHVIACRRLGEAVRPTEHDHEANDRPVRPPRPRRVDPPTPGKPAG